MLNATTVLTLLLGVASLYAGLCLVNITASLVVLSPGILDLYIAGQPSMGTYLLIPEPGSGRHIRRETQV